MFGSVAAKRARRKRERKQTGKSGHGTRGDEFGRFLNLDEAHAAVSDNGEVTLVAESRDIDAVDFTGLKDCHALWDFHGVPINEHFDHVFWVREMDSGFSHRGLGRWRRAIWSQAGLVLDLEGRFRGSF